jgi:hypothetical protein
LTGSIFNNIHELQKEFGGHKKLAKNYFLLNKLLAAYFIDRNYFCSFSRNKFNKLDSLICMHWKVSLSEDKLKVYLQCLDKAVCFTSTYFLHFSFDHFRKGNKSKNNNNTSADRTPYGDFHR